MGEAGKAAGRTGAPGRKGPEARTGPANAASVVQARQPFTAGKNPTRLRSWGETSEASAHIIALRIVAATAIPHPDRAFRDVKPGAIRANL